MTMKWSSSPYAAHCTASRTRLSPKIILRTTTWSIFSTSGSSTVVGSYRWTTALAVRSFSEENAATTLYSSFNPSMVTRPYSSTNPSRATRPPPIPSNSDIRTTDLRRWTNRDSNTVLFDGMGLAMFSYRAQPCVGACRAGEAAAAFPRSSPVSAISKKCSLRPSS